MGLLPLSWILDISHDTTILIGAITAIITGLIWLYRKIIRPAHKAIMAMADIVELQLTANGGSSVVDGVRQIKINHDIAEVHWKALELGQHEMRTEVAKLVERMELVERREKQ